MMSQLPIATRASCHHISTIWGEGRESGEMEIFTGLSLFPVFLRLYMHDDIEVCFLFNTCPNPLFDH